MEEIRLTIDLFFMSVWYGFLILSAHSLAEGLRMVIHHGKIAVFMANLLFWTIAAILTFQMLFLQNGGQLRNYVIEGLLVGMLAGICSTRKIILFLFGKLQKKQKSFLLKRREKKYKKEARRHEEKEKKRLCSPAEKTE